MQKVHSCEVRGNHTRRRSCSLWKHLSRSSAPTNMEVLGRDAFVTPHSSSSPHDKPAMQKRSADSCLLFTSAKFNDYCSASKQQLVKGVGAQGTVAGSGKCWPHFRGSAAWQSDALLFGLRAVMRAEVLIGGGVLEGFSKSEVVSACEGEVEFSPNEGSSNYSVLFYKTLSE